jgi:hypothetical protein
MQNLKTFFIKTVDNRIKEFDVYHRPHNNDMVDVVIMTGYMDEEEGKVQGVTKVHKSSLSQVLNKIYQKVIKFGYKDNYQTVMDNPYNTFEDSKPKPSRVSKHINSMEGLRFPLYCQPTYGSYVHYNGELRDVYGEVVQSPLFDDLCKEVMYQLTVPFDAVITSKGLLIADIMLMDNTPFHNREAIMDNVDVKGVGVVDTKYIKDKAELQSYYTEVLNKGFKGLTVIGTNSLYIPGFNKTSAFLLHKIKEEESIVIGIDNKEVTVVKDNLELTTIEKENVDILDIVTVSL